MWLRVDQRKKRLVLLLRRRRCTVEVMLRRHRRRQLLRCEEGGRTRRWGKLLRRLRWLEERQRRRLTMQQGKQLVLPWCLKEGALSRQLVQLGRQRWQLEPRRRVLL